MKAIVLITVALAVTAVLTSAVLTTAQKTPGTPGVSDLASMAIPKAVIMALASGGASGGNVTFTVPYSAKMYEVNGLEYGSVSTTKAPVRGSLNSAAGTGVLSTADVLPATTTTDYLNKSVVPVAGTNTVIVLKGLNLTAGAGGNYIFESGQLSIYLPDGTLSTFALNRPIRLDYSPDRTSFTIQADPAVASTIAGTLGSKVTFPAGAKPVPMGKLLASSS